MCKGCDVLTLRMTRKIFEHLQRLLANNKLIDGDEEIQITLEEVMTPELTLWATRRKREA
ncbi:hypothetical protein LCGC14_2110630 [marine sediment metagenome]|uniref:Uncharacterized protein n=1 Tax=marine sediment metagenome TaxID=412755 RepID=A0A0F9GKE4_9ZZZZ